MDWLEPIANETIVYNKATSLNTKIPVEKFQDVRTLPNVGRESHTYLTYVIENYDTLPDVITFSQGRIDDHGYPRPLETLLELAEQASRIQCSKIIALAYSVQFLI